MGYNSNLVFKRGKFPIQQLIKYFSLATLLLFISKWSIEWIIMNSNLHVIAARMISEIPLFLASFIIQDRLIFHANNKDEQF